MYDEWQRDLKSKLLLTERYRNTIVGLVVKQLIPAAFGSKHLCIKVPGNMCMK